MIVLLALLLVACGDDGGPRLQAVTPASASANALVTLTGTRLCGPNGDCAHAAGQIQLGLDPPVVEAVIASYADTSAQIVVPPVAPVGKTSIIVTVDDKSSNSLSFEVLP